jgi:hypothetical protein
MKAPKVKPTEAEKALERVSVSQWNDYVGKFRPAEAALAKKIELTEGERAQVKGQVAADTAAAFKGVARSTTVATSVAGANVASGRSKFTLAENIRAEAKAKGVGQAGAETGAEISEVQGKQRLAAFGRGVSADVTENLQSGAVRATNLALAEARAKFAKNESVLESASTLAGFAFKKFRTFQQSKAVDKSLLPVFEDPDVF